MKGGEKVLMASYHKYYHPDENAGICVVKREGENDEDLLKRFRKKFSKSGIIKELRDRSYYEKPSDKKRRKRSQAIRAKEKDFQKELEQQRNRFKKKFDQRDPKGDGEK